MDSPILRQAIALLDAHPEDPAAASAVGDLDKTLILLQLRDSVADGIVLTNLAHMLLRAGIRDLADVMDSPDGFFTGIRGFGAGSLASVRDAIERLRPGV